MEQQLPPDVRGSDQEHVKLTRATVACRRCRRLRTKCVYSNGKPPCEGCNRAGLDIAATCYFPARGHSRRDREFRVNKSNKSDRQLSSPGSSHDSVTIDSHISPILAQQGIPSPSHSTGGNSVSLLKAMRNVLPPAREVIEGCKVFWTSFLQLGFFPKRLFLEKLSQDIDSVSLFVLLGILSNSCRFTPSLIKRYGSCQAAGDYFIGHATSLVLDALYEPSLENIQGFFLLALAQWGSGDKDKSSMNMGIAVRMAGILRLHREETYNLPPDATTDEIVNSEIARRTFWVLETEDNLHSSHASPVAFGADDITTLLPCEESDFAFGRIPSSRAALPGTKAAKLWPELTSLPSRSLFATLLQAHSLWGSVARKAWRADFCSEGPPPWDHTSTYAKMCQALTEWERDTPASHRWSVWNMRGHSAEQVHAAYLSVVMVTRLSHIVIRRIYLEEMIASVTQPGKDSAPPGFWNTIADELFENVFALHEPVNTFVSNRSPHEGFSATLLFSLYVCGTLYVHLLRMPALCPRLASRAQPSLSRTLEILEDLQNAWPLASRWLTVLRNSATSIPARSSTASSSSPQRDQLLADNGPSCPEIEVHGENGTRNNEGGGSLEMLSEAAVSAERNSIFPGGFIGPINRGNNVHGNQNKAIDEFLTFNASEGGSGFLIRHQDIYTDNGVLFDKELTEFLNQPSYGMVDIWVPPEQESSWMSSGE
ncbi:hypothetical protein EYB25_006339 [Talaromyces marneffei]|nr:uncharacterized protein EYB26_006367 [Talaromyces marneffei]KAE8552445.1 hypothetical protein EYB25_006339 [Talaromyces marneffei]QGA18682.1 hypothetical protein EYB26_006367 [Talaromyces marneffei]